MGGGVVFVYLFQKIFKCMCEKTYVDNVDSSITKSQLEKQRIKFQNHFKYMCPKTDVDLVDKASTTTFQTG